MKAPHRTAASHNAPRAKPAISDQFTSYGAAIAEPSYGLDFETQDDRFREALLREIGAGTERCPTRMSSHFGTRRPISGYTRSD
jgi:hypothetical protein